MVKRRLTVLTALAALALLAGACVPLPPPTETPAATTATALPATATPLAEPTASIQPATGTPAIAGATLRPPSAELCNGMAQVMMQALPGVEVTQAVAPVAINDVARDTSGTACRALAAGTGETFSSPFETVQAITRVLVEGGWQEDMNLIADGATGTATGYRSGDNLCLVAAGWNPGPTVSCPADRPIFECDVPRDQQIYEVTVDCATSAQ
jgi:hypothetical protein